MTAFPGEKQIIKTYCSNQTYYLGCLGNYQVVHVECRMGSSGIAGSINTTRDAIEAWSPQGVIMLGICFGVDNKKQNIGDVLISESIQPYDNRRVSQGKENIQYRSAIPTSSVQFFNRFINVRDWEHFGINGKKLTSKPGPLLSGESLIDNLDERKKLVQAFPNSIGGEMEGAGIYSAAASKSVDWIVIKAICDYADGKKRRKKTQKQEAAAKAVMDFANHALQSDIIFNDLGIRPVSLIEMDRKKADEDIEGVDVNAVLFDIYEPKYENHYFERKVDEDIKELIQTIGIWISGNAGVGKTTAIRRALYSCPDFIYVSLEMCGNQGVVAMLGEMHSLICAKFSLEAEFEEKAPIESLVEVISALGKGNILVSLYIDELPLEKPEDYREFIDSLNPQVKSADC